jgi:hypothetical protein
MGGGAPRSSSLGGEPTPLRGAADRGSLAPLRTQKSIPLTHHPSLYLKTQLRSSPSWPWPRHAAIEPWQPGPDWPRHYGPIFAAANNQEVLDINI